MGVVGVDDIVGGRGADIGAGIILHVGETLVHRRRTWAICRNGTRTIAKVGVGHVRMGSRGVVEGAPAHAVGLNRSGTCKRDRIVARSSESGRIGSRAFNSDKVVNVFQHNRGLVVVGGEDKPLAGVGQVGLIGGITIHPIICVLGQARDGDGVLAITCNRRHIG